MAKKIETTYDKFLKKLNKEELQEFEQEYESLVLSEIILAIMHEDGVTVRKLAKEAGISPTIIQGVRSGTRRISAQSFLKIFKGLGYDVFAKRDNHIIQLNDKK